jgi:hypothetical protein
MRWSSSWFETAQERLLTIRVAYAWLKKQIALAERPKAG